MVKKLAGFLRNNIRATINTYNIFVPPSANFCIRHNFSFFFPHISLLSFIWVKNDKGPIWPQPLRNWKTTWVRLLHLNPTWWTQWSGWGQIGLRKGLSFFMQTKLRRDMWVKKIEKLWQMQKFADSGAKLLWVFVVALLLFLRSPASFLTTSRVSSIDVDGNDTRYQNLTRKCIIWTFGRAGGNGCRLTLKGMNCLIRTCTYLI